SLRAPLPISARRFVSEPSEWLIVNQTQPRKTVAVAPQATSKPTGQEAPAAAAPTSVTAPTTAATSARRSATPRRAPERRPVALAAVIGRRHDQHRPPSVRGDLVRKAPLEALLQAAQAS